MPNKLWPAGFLPISLLSSQFFCLLLLHLPCLPPLQSTQTPYHYTKVTTHLLKLFNYYKCCSFRCPWTTFMTVVHDMTQLEYIYTTKSLVLFNYLIWVCSTLVIVSLVLVWCVRIRILCSQIEVDGGRKKSGGFETLLCVCCVFCCGCWWVEYMAEAEICQPWIHIHVYH